jgi:hypothetical protein
MQSTMTMEAFLAEVTRRENAKKDLLVPPKNMLMEFDGEHLSVATETGTFGMKETAHLQIATKLGIPKTYYDESSKIPGLRAYNVNAWLNEDKDRRLVRVLDNDVRAILSDRFKPVDNFTILSAALPVLSGHKDLEVISSQITDARMYLQIVFPKLQSEVKVGDAMRYGITFTNSEIGMGRISIQEFLYRLVCRNGAVGQSLLRQNHVGGKAGEVFDNADLYSDKTLKLYLEAFQSELSDVLRNAVTHAKLDDAVSRFKIAAGEKIDRDPEKVEAIVENITKKYTLTKEDGKGILANLWQGGDLSFWGVGNAVTALVHTTENADKQYDLERAGYEIMSLPAVWKSIAKVA